METKRNNIPKLRFYEFSEAWKDMRFNEIYSFYTTNSFTRDCLNYEKEGEVYNIHYGDIHIKFSTLFNIEQEQVPFINKNINLTNIKEESYCKKGDLIIADASEDYKDIGKTIEIINLNNKRTLAGLHTFLARPNKFEMSIGYSGYMMQTWRVRKQVMMIAQGSKVLGIATGRLGKVELKIPQTPEQQKIASFLTTVDTKIDQLTQKKSLLEQYKKGVMQQIFSQQLRFKDANNNEYHDWEEKKLSQICDYKNGGSFENLINENGKYNLITLNSIDIKGNLKSEHKKVVKTDNSLEKGDLVMVLSDVAHGYFLGLTDVIPNDNFVLNQRMGALRLKVEVNRYYLKSYINKNQKYFKLKGQGSSQQNLGKDDILNFRVLLPKPEEQTKIAIFLSAIDKKIEIVNTHILSIQQFKKGLLQQLFV